MLWGARTGLAACILIFLIAFAAPVHAAPCGPVSAPCFSQSQCCSNYCNPSGFCAPKPCALPSQACDASQPCCSGTCNSGICSNAPPPGGSDPYANIYIWVGLACIISATFLALAYMAAKLFELQALDAWVKIELQELVASFLIAVFCIAMIATVNGAAQFLSGESGTTNVIDSARIFLKDRLYADGSNLYKKLANVYFDVARVASFSYTAGTSVEIASISISQAPGSGLSGLVSELGQGMDAVSNFMLLAAAQSAFLLFFRSAAAVMLPVGIFLRSFSLTRKIGGVVLAAVIATAVIYPAAILISREVYAPLSASMNAKANNIHVTTAENPPGAQLICSPIVQRFVQSPIPFLGGEMGWWITICSIPCIAAVGGWGACMAACAPWVFTSFYIAKSIFPIIGYFILSGFASKFGNYTELVNNYYTPIETYALPAVSQYVVLSLISFLIPVIIAIVLLRNFAVMFGGEPQLYGLSKLV